MAASDSNHIAVDIEEVTFRYGNIRALDGLSLAVPAGISFGLLGPNGAGKTTLIRLLVGLLKPRNGSVRVLGEVPSRHTASRVGYMPQLHSLYTELSVRQNVEFFARINRLTDRAERTRRVEDTIRLEPVR